MGPRSSGTSRSRVWSARASSPRTESSLAISSQNRISASRLRRISKGNSSWRLPSALALPGGDPVTLLIQSFYPRRQAPPRCPPRAPVDLQKSHLTLIREYGGDVQGDRSRSSAAPSPLQGVGWVRVHRRAARPPHPDPLPHWGE